MTKSELYQSLNYVDATRQRRTEMASLVLSNPHFVQPLLEICFAKNDPVSSKACWVLEYTVKADLSSIFPYLDSFNSKLGMVHLDSSVRPIAKICELLIKSYFSKTDNGTKKVLTDEHLEQITTACFDWLIGNHKVAAKAYSMTSLLLLGRKFDWIHSELQLILEQNYAEGSAAYKARARMTLDKIVAR